MTSQSDGQPPDVRDVTASAQRPAFSPGASGRCPGDAKGEPEERRGGGGRGGCSTSPAPNAGLELTDCAF